MNELLANYDIVMLLAAALIAVVALYRFDASPITVAAATYVIVQCISVAYTRTLVTVVLQENKDLARVVFYFGYAALDIAMLFVIYLVHSRLRIQFTAISAFMCLSYMAFAVLLIARYYDRSLGFNMMADMFKVAIPTINTVICLVMIVCICVKWSSRRPSTVI